jgi:hypothetical protein
MVSTVSPRPSTGRTGQQASTSPASSASRARETSGRSAAPTRGSGQDAGRFDDEIVPVGDVAADEGVRRDTTLEKLAALQPVFDPEARRPPATPGVNDGASCVVVCSRSWRSAAPEPLATIAQGYVADDYAYLARTPARAGQQALEKAGKSIDDVSRIEINEAFSSVAKNSTRMLGADGGRQRQRRRRRSATDRCLRRPHRRDAGDTCAATAASLAAAICSAAARATRSS